MNSWIKPEEMSSSINDKLETISAESLYSEEYFKDEVEHVFRDTWMCICRKEELPSVGDYIVKSLPVFKTSIIIVNTDAGLRAFHNVCAHRGNKLLCKSSGKTDTFTCGFHGWTYDLLGELRAIPDPTNFAGIDTAEYGLTSIAVDSWNGFVFIHMGNPSASLESYMGEATEFFEGYDFNQPVAWAYAAEVEANWKVALGGFLEQYHFAFAHRTTVADAFMPKENPFGRLDWLGTWGLHSACSAFGNPTPKLTEVEKAARGKNGLAGRRPEGRMGAGMNPAKHPNWVLDGAFIFPIFIVQARPGSFHTWWFWPISEGKTLFEARRYEAPAQTAGELFFREHYRCVVRDTFTQDLFAFENIQEVVSSGAKQSFVLGESESRLAHLHRTVESFLDRK